MSLKLRAFPIAQSNGPVDAKKRSLWERHQDEIQQVLGKAKSLSQDSQRALKDIKEKGLRDIAKG